MSGGSERERLAAAVDAIEQFIETGTGFPGGTPRFHARAALVLVKQALAHVAEERARLVAALRKLEWSGPFDGGAGRCPTCGALAAFKKTEGHKPSCELAALLADPAAATPVHHADRISSAGVVTPSCRPGVLGDGERASMEVARVTCVECRRVIAAPDAAGGGA